MGYYVTVEPGVNIYVEDINPGGSKTIVFIHGWPVSHKQFEYQFDVLPALGYRCIGIDWRGFGIRINQSVATLITDWQMISVL
jgi:non-heme chloroperoxidase